MPTVLEKIEHGDAFLVDERGRVVGLQRGGSPMVSFLDAENTIRPSELTSAGLQAAHDEALATKKILDLGGKTYQITTPVTFRTASVIIRGNGATLDATNMSGLYAVRADSAASDLTFGAKIASIENLRIQGPTGVASSTGIKGLWVNGTAATKSPRPTLKNVHIDGFGIGIDLGDYAYLMQLESCEVRGAGIGMRQSIGVDSGENTLWSGGAIYNCSEMCVQTFDESSELFFHGVSFDYTPKVIEQNAGRVCFTDCHVENNGAGWTDDAFYITGDGTDFQMTGGYLVSASSQPTGIAQLINVADTKSRAIFTRVFVNNFGNTANKIATGLNVIFQDTQVYNNGLNTNPTRITDSGSLLFDGSFEASTFPRDLWSLMTDSAGTATSRTTGANGTLSLSSAAASAGSKSLLINKTGAGAFVVTLLVPIKRLGGPVTGQFKHSAVAGTPLTGAATAWDTGWVCNIGQDANTIPINGATTITGSGSFTPTVGTWNNVNVRTGVRPPSYASHAFVRFTLPSANTGGLNLDEFSMYQW